MHSAHCGLHQWEGHYIVEIVDPQTGEPVPDGEVGEVVATALTREALPVVRFRTGDLSRVVSRERCACGRTGLRLDRISGRLDDMLIISGVNFFPLQVEKALLKIPGVLPNYRLIVQDHDGTKKLRVEVEAEAGGYGAHRGQGPQGGAGLHARGRRVRPRHPAARRRQGQARGVRERVGESTSTRNTPPPAPRGIPPSEGGADHRGFIGKREFSTATPKTDRIPSDLALVRGMW